jgi:hypothetical protein
MNAPKEITWAQGIRPRAVNTWLTMFRRFELYEAVTTTASPSGASTTFSPQAWAKSRV